MEKVAIVENLRRGDNTPLCCNWNPTSSNATTSSFDKLVFIFTGHVLGTIGQFNTFFILPHTQHLMSSRQNQNSYPPLLGERNYFMSPLYVEASVLCFPIPNLTLHIVPIITCSVQHCLAELGGNIAMCNLDARQSISNTDVLWATPWISNSTILLRVDELLMYWDDEWNSSLCRVDESHIEQFGAARVLNLSMTISKNEPTKWWISPLTRDLRRWSAINCLLAAITMAECFWCTFFQYFICNALVYHLQCFTACVIGQRIIIYTKMTTSHRHYNRCGVDVYYSSMTKKIHICVERHTLHSIVDLVGEHYPQQIGE